MSTRGVTGFKIDGKLKITYNHSDSYPEWLGQRMVEFCKIYFPENIEQAKKRVRKVVMVSNKKKPTRNQIEKYKKYSDLGVSENNYFDWYCLLRRLQGIPILNEILQGRVYHMYNYETFLRDELDCQWGYIINLDDETLEVWHRGDKLYDYDLHNLPKFMLGVTNDYKKEYTYEFQTSLQLSLTNY